AQIEARILAWAAGQKDVVEAFRAFDAGTGPDLYRVAASRIYSVPVAAVSGEQRRIGKIAALALGYAGGVPAFSKIARNYAVVLDEDTVKEIRDAWRAANPHVTQFWQNLNDAAIECVSRSPGSPVTVPGGHGIQFQRDNRKMTMRLPSSRKLIYWEPVLKQ